jgi:hypothetical protein
MTDEYSLDSVDPVPKPPRVDDNGKRGMLRLLAATAAGIQPIDSVLLLGDLERMHRECREVLRWVAPADHDPSEPD